MLDIVAHNPDGPTAGRAQAADHIDRRSFARAIGTQQTKDLALLNAQREMIDGLKRAKRLTEIDDLDSKFLRLLHLRILSCRFDMRWLHAPPPFCLFGP